MAGLIFLGLIALMVITLIVMLVMRKGWKKTLVTFVGFLVVIGLFNLYVIKTCGPNAKDVEIMTPQAEAIANYILKNGIPESLAEIPGLPYELIKCEEESYFANKSLQKTGKDGDHKIFQENCFFVKSDVTYEIKIFFVEKYKGDELYAYSDLELYARENKTGMNYGFKYDRNSMEWIYKDYINNSNRNPHIYDNKTTGLCNTLRM